MRTISFLRFGYLTEYKYGKFQLLPYLHFRTVPFLRVDLLCIVLSAALLYRAAH